MINALIEDFGKKNLIIICDKESLDVAEDFKDKLLQKNIESLLISEDEFDLFNATLSGDDFLLVLSKTGQNPMLRKMIVKARRKNLKVYGVYNNFRCGLALLSDKYFITSKYSNFLNTLFMMMNLQNKKSMPQKANVFSHVNGSIIRVNVTLGDEVKKGSVLAIIESMKMEMELVCDMNGIVDEIWVAPGDAVFIDDPIMFINDE